MAGAAAVAGHGSGLAIRPGARQAEGRLQVGQPVHGDLAVLVAEQHRVGERLGPGAQVDAGRVDQRAVDPEPARGVVVAADQDDPGAGRAQPGECVLEQRHRVHRRNRPVVDVARDQHRVHPLRARRLDQVVEEAGLRLPQVGAVQRPPEVPVRGVQEAHGKDVANSPDIRARSPPRPLKPLSASRSRGAGPARSRAAPLSRSLTAAGTMAQARTMRLPRSVRAGRRKP